MKVNTPISDYPITPPSGSESITPNPQTGNSEKKASRSRFIKSLSRLFGFNKSASKTTAHQKLDFVKVDPESTLKVGQSKIGKVLKTKMSEKLEELFQSWLTDTYSNTTVLQDRFKRIAELEFAINNDPFLGMVADLLADEATQLDQQGQLIMVDCANPRMKQRMYELLEQWAITQNRVRGAIYNLGVYADAFWANKITEKGVIRIIPLEVRNVLERLEFNPIRVSTDITLKQGFLTAVNNDARLQMLIDTLESEAHEEFTDIFDSKLFGFTVSNDLVVPPWNITHFRLTAEQSEFYPYGKPLLLKALAPFKQANATMTLHSLARIMNFPITTYSVKTSPGMDEAQIFEKVNEVREEYDNIGVTGNSAETFSVNTRMWLAKDLVELEVHSPNIDLSSIGDLELYQDRVVVASGVPKGYLVPDWGGWGVSGISLTEQFKPFARKVFTLQSAFLEGLTNLFRLHFAITGEFDYYEPFILSMKFPNSEISDERNNAKQSSLELASSVIETISNLIASLNDPLPPEIVQDILTKFSFLDPKDIKKWIKIRTTKTQGENVPDESKSLGGSFSGGGGSSGGMPEVGGEKPEGGEGSEGEFEAGEGPGEGTPAEARSNEEEALADLDLEKGEITPEGEEPTSSMETETSEKEESYFHFVKKHLTEKRYKQLILRYEEGSENIAKEIMKNMSRFDEVVVQGRHYIKSHEDPSMDLTYKTLEKFRLNPTHPTKRTLKEVIHSLGKYNIKLEPEKDKEDLKASVQNMMNVQGSVAGDIPYTAEDEYWDERKKHNIDQLM